MEHGPLLKTEERVLVIQDQVTGPVPLFAGVSRFFMLRRFPRPSVGTTSPLSGSSRPISVLLERGYFLSLSQ